MDENKRQRIFFGVITIATLIIVLMGTTLAFFNATSKGTENAVAATADIVSISYIDSNDMKANSLIPATKEIVKLGYARTGDKKCIDDFDKQICSVYSFKINNDGNSAINITGKISGLENEFSHLKYLVYKADETTPIVDGELLPSVGEDISMFGKTGSKYNSVEIPIGDTQFYVVMYLEEANTQNDVEQGAKFKATASISLSEEVK